MFQACCNTENENLGPITSDESVAQGIVNAHLAQFPLHDVVVLVVGAAGSEDSDSTDSDTEEA